MGQLILKGDGRPEHSSTVISILENLGGINSSELSGNDPLCAYYIDKHNNIRISTFILNEALTVDQFLWAFPFKVGDNILTIQDGFEGTIVAMRWNEGTNNVLYDFKDNYNGTIRQNFSASDLELVVYRPNEDTDDDTIIDEPVEKEEPGPKEKLVHLVKGIPSTIDVYQKSTIEINQDLANGYTVAKMLPDPKEGIWVLLKRIN